MACDAVGITPDRTAQDQFGERHPGRHGPRRDGRAGAAYQHGRGRAPRGGVGQVRARAPPADWRPARAPTHGAWARACRISPRRPTRSRSCAFSSSTRRRSRNIDAILAVEGIDVFFIGPSDLSQSMGYPGNPKAPPVAKAIERAHWRESSAAGRTPGMPATSETLDEVLGRGCRYVYTHLPRLLSIGASAFLSVVVAPHCREFRRFAAGGLVRLLPKRSPAGMPGDLDTTPCNTLNGQTT